MCNWSTGRRNIQLDWIPSARTQKSILKKNGRATTHPRPLLESSCRGKSRSAQVTFFLSGPHPIQYWSPNGTLSTPSVGTLNGPLKRPSDPFRVECPQSIDSADLGHTRHVNYIVPSCHFTIMCQNWSIDFWMLLKVNKFGLADSFFVEYPNTL